MDNTLFGAENNSLSIIYFNTKIVPATKYKVENSLTLAM